MFEVARLGVEGFEFLVQRFELFLEILVAHGFAGGHAHVAPGIERPALRFDFLERGGAAQAGHVRCDITCGLAISSGFAEDFFELRAGFVAAEGEVEGFAAIEADEVGEEANLRGRPFAVRAVHLPVDVAGIDEQDGVGTIR